MTVTTPTGRFDFAADLPPVRPGSQVHLIAIGGSGMSAVARLLLAQGMQVTGSDVAEGSALESLREAGATVQVGHDAGNVEGADLVVVSSAISDDNAELVAARAAKIPVLHRAQALAAIMGDARRLAVAGANGKTTTTAMVTVALREADLDPSFACGATIAGVDSNAAWTGGDVFVVEADESDGSFLSYRPRVAIVTSVQPDHLDFYGTFASVEAAYAAFAESIVDGGLLVVCADDAGAMRLAERSRGSGHEVLTYGFADGADVHLSDYETQSTGLATATTLTTPDGNSVPLVVQVPGVHNVLNAAAAYAAAVFGCGADPKAVLRGVAAFTGAHRRFEVRGEIGGVSVIDDYAHNPAKVAAVVETAHQIAARRGARVHVAFQPHLFSRTQHFAEEFARALAPASTVAVLDIYGARELPMPGVTSELISGPLRSLPGERSVTTGGTFADAARFIAGQTEAGDLVLTVGAGDVTQLAPLITKVLRERDR